MEIGGYLEIEKFGKTPLHGEAVKLSSARNGMAYLIRAKKIDEIYLPYYLCDSVVSVCEKHKVKVHFYNIDKNFLPLLDGVKDKWVYVVNYYGQLNKNYIKFLSKTNRIILDNVQAYFEKPIPGIDTIYSCRKFFGVPDGGFLYTDAKVSGDLPESNSYLGLTHLFGRYEKTANEFFATFRENEERIDGLPLSKMSKTTFNLLSGIDYNRAKAKRTANFNYLFKVLQSKNQLNLKKVKGAFCYPFLVDDGEALRQKLIAEKIYVPTLWPNVLVNHASQRQELNFAKNLLPLPCDQRYNKDDMKKIISIIKGR